MLSLSGLQAFPFILALAAPIHAETSAVRTIDAQHEERSPLEQTDVFFHPFGVALILGSFGHDISPVPPTYPTDPGGPNTPVDPPPSGGKPVGDPPPLGGDPPPSGGDPPPPPTVNNTPEPATLISGMIGAGLVGLVGRRRRKRKEDAVQ